MKAPRIAEPCSASWEAMPRVPGGRFCGSCRRTVHDLCAADPLRVRALAALYSQGLCVRQAVSATGELVFGRAAMVAAAAALAGPAYAGPVLTAAPEVTEEHRVVVVVQGGARPVERVEFDRGAATPAARSEALVQIIAQVLLDNPHVQRVEIAGHTSTDEPVELGQARAEAVVAALVAHGVARERLVPVSVGAERPLSPDGPANRRVELRILDEAPLGG